MTVLGLRADFNKFGTYFKYKMKGLSACTIMQMILGLLSYPFLLTVAALYLDVRRQREEASQLRMEMIQNQELYYALCDKENMLEMFTGLVMVICVLALIGIFLMNLITMLNAFRWLYRKNIVDMDYSLPVTSDTRFWGDFLAGFLSATVPHIISVIIGMLLLNLPAFALAIGEQFEIFRSTAIGLMWTGVAASVMFYCFSLLIASCCGGAGHARLMPILLSLAVPVVHWFTMMLSMIGAYGYDCLSSVNDYITVAGTSPCGMLFLAALSMLDSELFGIANDNYVYLLLRPEVLIPFVLITLASVVGAYLLVKVRRAERVGSAYVFKAAKYIFQTIITLAIVMIFALVAVQSLADCTLSETAPTIIFGALFVTFAVYIAMEAASNGGVKGLHWGILRYAVTIAGSAVICFALICSEGFGVGYRVPNPDDAVIAGVNFGTLSFDSDFEQPENIRLVTEAQKALKKEKPYSNVFEGIKNGYCGSHFRYRDSEYQVAFRYRMKNGSEKNYYFYITKEENDNIVKTLTVPEKFLSSYQYLICMDYGYNVNRAEAFVTGISSDAGKNYSALKSELSVQELYDAIAADAQKVTFDLVNQAEAGIYEKELVLSLKYKETALSEVTLNIFPWFDNTISLLKQHGYDVDFSIDMSRFSTAFLIRSEGAPIEMREYLLSYISIADLYGLAGDPAWDVYAMRQGMYGYYEEYYIKNGEEYVVETTVTDEDKEQAHNNLKVNYDNLTVVALDPADPIVSEIAANSSSNIDRLAGIDKTCYLLVLTTAVSDDLLHEDNTIFEKYNMTLHVCENYNDRAEEILNR